ncbi:MAG TPA: epoxide hydrolase [Candidatus Limnocylindrales bacterium]|nr:epoxide hydrolase [Candidatus Limnocylindrales bacterium]
MSERGETFTVHFDESELTELRRRLASTRLPAAVEGAGWDYGIDTAWLADLLEYWRTGFGWRIVERELNRYRHAYLAVDGLRVHFLEARSPHPGALPLLLTHGWPGSVLEFLKVLGPLTDPVAHGGSASDAFHVIAPSIPGYGLSEAPHVRGFDVKAVAATLAGLMRSLGFDRYGAQGGDWGAMTNAYVALAAPENCIGLHLNLVLAGMPPDGPGDLSETEIAALVDARAYMKDRTAYQRVQGLEPDLIGIALEDSPAALCAWIVSKFQAWGDCNGDVEKRFSRDELLANVTWYWLTRSATSAARLYYETKKSGRFGPVESRVETPTGCAIFPRELFRPPRAWAERLFNVTRWTEMKAGGHFAAMEEPEALVEDVRGFFRTVR